MTAHEPEFLAALDERIERLEKLLIRALCKCVVFPTAYSTRGCPIHDLDHRVSVQQILRDQGRA